MFIKRLQPGIHQRQLGAAPQASKTSVYAHFSGRTVCCDVPSAHKGRALPPPPAAVRSCRYKVIEGFQPSGGITGEKLKVGFNSPPEEKGLSPTQKKRRLCPLPPPLTCSCPPPDLSTFIWSWSLLCLSDLNQTASRITYQTSEGGRLIPSDPTNS